MAMIFPQARVWVGVSLTNMMNIDFGPMVAGVQYWRQNDPPGSKPDLAAADLEQRIVAQGKRLKVSRPPAAFKDVNDYWQHLLKQRPILAAGGGR